MKKIILQTGLFIVFAINGFSQVERADIIEKRIRSVKKTIYLENVWRKP